MSELVRRRAAVVLGLLITTAVGCDLLGRKLNPAFCAAHPDEVACRQAEPDAAPDTPIDGPPLCTANSDCQGSAGNPVCDLNDTKMCVQCTLTDNPCPMAMPICLNKQCNKCTQHAQCMSNVCLSEGTCADATKVAYVAQGGAGSECTKTAPCGTLTAGLSKNLPFVKIAAGAIVESSTTTIDSRTVTIVAERGAKLDRDGDGAILEVTNNADVKILDLEITGGTGTTDAAVSLSSGMPKLTLTRVIIHTNQGLGISAAAGLLTVSRSTIRNNTGGGIEVTRAEFDITNSVIASNGGPSTAFGGVNFQQTGVGTRRFDFNTVTNNNGNSGQAIGVVCSLIASTQTMTFSSNIVYNNQTGDGRMQTGGANCEWIYSDIGPDSVTGTGNINVDPLFVDQGRNDFHLMTSSPVRDLGDPAAMLTEDFDGDVRPQGLRRDIGADELPPP